MFIIWLCWLFGKRNEIIWRFDRLSIARVPYGYLWTWNWPITAREISQPYNKSHNSTVQVLHANNKCIVRSMVEGLSQTAKNQRFTMIYVCDIKLRPQLTGYNTRITLLISITAWVSLSIQIDFGRIDQVGLNWNNTSNIFAQHVKQHCCIASWCVLLRVLSGACTARWPARIRTQSQPSDCES